RIWGFYQGTEHCTIKYLNNLIEQDHRPVKRHNKFYRSLRTASTTIKGMEAIRGLYKKTRKEGTLFGFSVCTEIKVSTEPHLTLIQKMPIILTMK
ncbi:DDE-type integrase/transposase/recombinase, partial [Streptococcus thermophilus]|nr:DDE-type integrase/transposase/recombinase [Streptococcus thermophilus]